MTLDAQSLVAGVNEVYSLPHVYYQIDTAIADPASTASRIGKIISEDPGLTARLLRVVNSAFYGLPSTIDTISRAVTVIGTQQLRDLVLATSVINLFEGLPGELVNMESFWRHSVACGVAARVLATYRHEANVEKYFVGGLLHDIGSLVLYSKIPEQALDILKYCDEKKELLHRAEEKQLGFTHADVGGLLLAQWHLPASLVEMARYHHSPENASHYSTEAAVIHVADIIAYGLELGTGGERFVPTMSEQAWERLGLSEGIFSSAIPLMEKQYSMAIANIVREPS